MKKNKQLNFVPKIDLPIIGYSYIWILSNSTYDMNWRREVFSSCYYVRYINTSFHEGLREIIKNKHQRSKMINNI